MKPLAAKTSAGILLYRIRDGEAEVLLDRWTFEAALRQKRLTPLRSYLYSATEGLGRRLLGRHVPQAMQAIQKLYDDKAQQYQKTAPRKRREPLGHSRREGDPRLART